MPYVPRRQGLKAFVAEATPRASKTTWAKFASDVLTSKMSAVLAFVVVIGFASSVASVAQLAAAEILSVPEALPLQHKVASIRGEPKVLGDFISPYGSNVLVNNRTLKITYGPIDNMGNNWSYGFNMTRYANRQGSIKITTTDSAKTLVYAADVNATHDIITGYGFAPNTKYRFEYYSQTNYRGTLLLRKFFTTPQITTPTPPPQIACTQEVKICPDGSYVARQAPSCEFRACPQTPPAYGYQTVNVGPISQGSWKEGWIERVEYGSNIAPGIVRVYGWVYEANLRPSVNMTLRNRDTGVEYRPDYISYDMSNRADVSAFIRGKTYISNPEVNYISVQFSNLPAGYYYIFNAKYNNNLFNIHNQSYQPIYISPTPPSYGYQTVPVGPVAPTTWREGWLEQVSYNTRGDVRIRGWAYDGGNYPGLDVRIRNTSTNVIYSPTGTNWLDPRPDVVNYLNSKVLGGIDTYRQSINFEVVFGNLPAGTYVFANGLYNGYQFNTTGSVQGAMYVNNDNQNKAFVEGIVYNNNTQNVNAGQTNQLVYSFHLTAGSQNLQVSGFEFEIAKFPGGEQVDGKVSGVVARYASDDRVRTNIVSSLANKRITTTFNGTTLTIPARATYDFNVFADFAKSLPDGNLSIVLKKVMNVGDQPVLGSDSINGVINVIAAPSEPPFINVTWPRYSDTLTLGKTYTIKWDTNIDSSSKVNLYLMGNTMGGYTNRGFIGKNLPNSGSFVWDSGKALADPYPAGMQLTEDSYAIGISLADGSQQTNGDYFNMITDPAKPRVNLLVIVNGTVYLVGPDGLYGIPDLATFNSWGYSFNDLKDANDGEKALKQVGLIPTRDPYYATPFEQLNARKIKVDEVSTPLGKIGEAYSGFISWSSKNITSTSTLSATLTGSIPPGLSTSPSGSGTPLKFTGLTPLGKLTFTGTPTQDGVYNLSLSLSLDGHPEVSYASNFTIGIGNVDIPRVGKVIAVNDTVYLVGNKGLYGFVDVPTFVSWGLSFTDVVPANNAEYKLNQMGLVPKKTASMGDITIVKATEEWQYQH